MNAPACRRHWLACDGLVRPRLLIRNRALKLAALGARPVRGGTARQRAVGARCGRRTKSSTEQRIRARCVRSATYNAQCNVQQQRIRARCVRAHCSASGGAPACIDGHSVCTHPRHMTLLSQFRCMLRCTPQDGVRYHSLCAYLRASTACVRPPTACPRETCRGFCTSSAAQRPPAQRSAAVQHAPFQMQHAPFQMQLGVPLQLLWMTRTDIAQFAQFLHFPQQSTAECGCAHVLYCGRTPSVHQPFSGVYVISCAGHSIASCMLCVVRCTLHVARVHAASACGRMPPVSQPFSDSFFAASDMRTCAPLSVAKAARLHNGRRGDAAQHDAHNRRRLCSAAGLRARRKRATLPTGTCRDGRRRRERCNTMLQLVATCCNRLQHAVQRCNAVRRCRASRLRR